MRNSKIDKELILFLLEGCVRDSLNYIQIDYSRLKTHAVYKNYDTSKIGSGLLRFIRKQVKEAEFPPSVENNREESKLLVNLGGMEIEGFKALLIKNHKKRTKKSMESNDASTQTAENVQEDKSRKNLKVHSSSYGGEKKRCVRVNYELLLKDVEPILGNIVEIKADKAENHTLLQLRGALKTMMREQLKVKEIRVGYDRERNLVILRLGSYDWEIIKRGILSKGGKNEIAMQLNAMSKASLPVSASESDVNNELQTISNIINDDSDSAWWRLITETIESDNAYVPTPENPRREEPSKNFKINIVNSEDIGKKRKYTRINYESLLKNVKPDLYNTVEIDASKVESHTVDQLCDNFKAMIRQKLHLEITIESDHARNLVLLRLGRYDWETLKNRLSKRTEGEINSRSNVMSEINAPYSFYSKTSTTNTFFGVDNPAVQANSGAVEKLTIEEMESLLFSK